MKKSNKNQRKMVNKKPIGFHGAIHYESINNNEHYTTKYEVIYDDGSRGPLTIKTAKQLGIPLSLVKKK